MKASTPIADQGRPESPYATVFRTYVASLLAGRRTGSHILPQPDLQPRAVRPISGSDGPHVLPAAVKPMSNPRRAIEGRTAGAAVRLLAAACVLFALARPAQALDPHLAVSQYVFDNWQIQQGLPQNSVEALARTPDGYLWLGDARRPGALRRRALHRFRSQQHARAALARHHATARRCRRTAVDRHARRRVDVRRRAVPGARRAGAARRLHPRHRLRRATGTSGSARSTPCSRSPARACAPTGASRDSAIPRSARCRSATTARCGPRRTSAASIAASADRFEKVAVAGDPSKRRGARDARRRRRRALDRHRGRPAVPRARRSVRAVRGRAESRRRRQCDPARSRRQPLGRNDGRGRAAAGQTARRAWFDMRDRTSNDVRALLEDPEGSLWIGTFGAGLERLHTGKFIPYGPAEGLPGSLAWSVAPSRDGGLWFGTDAGLTRYANGKFEYLAPRLGLAGRPRARGARGSLGRSLVRHAAAAALIDCRPGRLTRFSTAEGLSGDAVKAITQDHTRPHLDRHEHRRRYRRRGAASTPPPAALRALGPFMTSIVFEDRRKRMWIATDAFGAAHARRRNAASLWRRRRTAEPARAVDPRGCERRAVVRHARRARLLSRRPLRFARAGGAGVAREHAADRRGRARRAVVLDQSRPLRRRRARSSRRSWRAPARGPARSARYHMADGLRSNEFNGGNTRAGVRAADGTLWLPGIGGYRARRSEPHSYQRAAPAGAHRKRHRRWQGARPLTASVRAAPGSTNWEFQYTALSMVAPERVRFRYRLEGYQSEWIDAGTRRTAYYTRLPPGKYVFRVIASNDDGVWNEIGAALTLRACCRTSTRRRGSRRVCAARDAARRVPDVPIARSRVCSAARAS